MVLSILIAFAGRTRAMPLDNAYVLAERHADVLLGPFMVGVTAKDLGPQAFDTDGDDEGEGDGEDDTDARPARFVLGAGAYGQEVGIQAAPITCTRFGGSTF